MKEKRDLYYLVNIISAQTKLDPETVKKFINQLFKEIEKGLITSSIVKIDNFGIFRIIKSLSNDKILFLGKFNESENKEHAFDNLIELDKDNIEIENSPKEQEPFFSDDSWNNKNDSVDQPFKTKIDNAQFEFGSNIEAEEEDNEFYNDYTNKSKKKKFSTRIKMFFLFVIASLAVIAILYILYESSIKKDTVIKHKYEPEYAEILNEDTVKYSNIIIAKSNLDFMTLSKIFYEHEIFWPYIYTANKDEKVSPLEIKSGTIIKIPKLEKDLLDYNNKACTDSVKMLASQIIQLKEDVNLSDSLSLTTKVDSIQSDSLVLKNKSKTSYTKKKKRTNRKKSI